MEGLGLEVNFKTCQNTVNLLFKNLNYCVLSHAFRSAFPLALCSIKTLKLIMNKRIAFIAHDGKKAQMVSFVLQNKHLIEKSGYDIVATGTTGKHIAEAGLQVKTYASGPLGGDAQIASRIIEDKIVMVFFFRDPLGNHPHGVDVSMLMRVCDVYNIPLATNLKSAELILKSLAYAKAPVAA